MNKTSMVKIAAFLFLATACSQSAVNEQNAMNSQNKVTGYFPALSHQCIKLYGFVGFNPYAIDSVRADGRGQFTLSFGERDYGMGYLAADDGKPFLVILCREGITLKGEALSNLQTIEIVEGNENKLFEQYAAEHLRREQALSAWGFLSRIYQTDPLFSKHQAPKNAIETEIKRIKREDQTFLATLNPKSYVHWYLPIRKLVSAVPTIAQYRTNEIPETIAAFRSIDYTDPRLYKSGLLRDVIDSHVWLIENSGRPLDSVFVELNKSIDHIVENLVKDEKKFNEITDYLFKLLEKRSLFKSSEYLALKVLNETSCTLNSELATQLESYRAMKKGSIAPDFDFEKDILAPGYEPNSTPKKLSAVKSQYIVVVFGASWCPACAEDLSNIALLYKKWKKCDVEVVFVSLDEEQQPFKNFAGMFPFISVCDYKKWESPIVKAYHVFATPTLYLLDNQRAILLRPNSVSHLDSWVDWFLVQGNR